MTTQLKITQTLNGVELAVKVIPNASRDQIVGLLGNALKIKVTSPPESGKANKAVCKLLAKALDLPARDISVTSGQTQPNKTITTPGSSITPDQITQRLARYINT